MWSVSGHPGQARNTPHRICGVFQATPGRRATLHTASVECFRPPRAGAQHSTPAAHGVRMASATRLDSPPNADKPTIAPAMSAAGLFWLNLRLA